MNAKHTPGPWHVESDTDICGSAGGFIATAHMPSSAIGTEREYANARLIAAAPDLLELLCRARDELADLNQSENDGGEFLLAIDTATSKATGETP